MITGLAKLLSSGILRGGKILANTALHTGVYAGKGAVHGAAYASKLPYWYVKQFVKRGPIEYKIANLGNLGMFYKRNKRRWHDALNAGELIHPYNY